MAGSASGTSRAGHATPDAVVSGVPFLSASAAVGALFLAVVGVQAAKVGQVDPAEKLRSEQEPPAVGDMRAVYTTDSTLQAQFLISMPNSTAG